jgi:hypothetical protein
MVIDHNLKEKDAEQSELERNLNTLVLIGTFTGFFTGLTIFCVISFIYILIFEEKNIMTIIGSIFLAVFIIFFIISIVKMRPFMKESYKEITQNYVKKEENSHLDEK